MLTGCEDPEPLKVEIPPNEIKLAPLPHSGLNITSGKGISREVLFQNMKDELPAGLEVKSPLTQAGQTSEASRFQVEVEPNNTMAQATRIGFSGEVSGYVHPPLKNEIPDEDWFRVDVELEAQQLLSAQLFPVEGVDLFLEVWKKGLTGEASKIIRIDSHGAGQGEQLGHYALSNGTYFLLVSSNKGSKGYPWNIADPYKLRFKVGPVTADKELEPNNDSRRSNNLELGTRLQANLNFGDVDWFWVGTSTLPLDEMLALDLLPGVELNISWKIFTRDLVELASGESGKGQRISIPNLALFSDLEGFFITISAAGHLENFSEYSLLVETRAREGAVDLEPNDDPARGMELSVPATAKGWLHTSGDQDVFFISVEESTPVTFEVDGIPGVTLALAMLDSTGEPVATQIGEDGEGLKLPNWVFIPGKNYFSLRSVTGGNPGVSYSLVVQPREVGEEELEPNDSLELATPLALGDRGLKGWLVHNGDRDCFRLPSRDEVGPMRLGFEELGDRKMRATIYSSLGDAVEQVTIRQGGKESLAVPDSAGALPLVCIQATDETQVSAPNGYTVQVSKAEAEPLEDGR